MQHKEKVCTCNSVSIKYYLYVELPFCFVTMLVQGYSGAAVLFICLSVSVSVLLMLQLFFPPHRKLISCFDRSISTVATCCLRFLRREDTFFCRCLLRWGTLEPLVDDYRNENYVNLKTEPGCDRFVHTRVTHAKD